MNPPSLTLYVAFLFGPHVLKFLCYLLCFAKIVKHDNGLGKTVISKKRLNTRNQANVISLVGHFGIACLDIAFCCFWLMLNISVTTTDFVFIHVLKNGDPPINLLWMTICTPRIRKEVMASVLKPFQDFYHTRRLQPNNTSCTFMTTR